MAVEPKEDCFITRKLLYDKLTPAVRSSIGLPQITSDRDPRFGSRNKATSTCWAKIDASLQRLFPSEQCPPPPAFQQHCPDAPYPSFDDRMKKKVYGGKTLPNAPLLVGFDFKPSDSEAAAALATLGGAAGSS